MRWELGSVALAVAIAGACSNGNSVENAVPRYDAGAGAAAGDSGADSSLGDGSAGDGSVGDGSAGDGSGGSSGGDGGTQQAGVGEACDGDASCRVGLACESGSCQPAHSIADGDPCTIGPECQSGLQCVAGICRAAGSGGEGDACRGDIDCQAGLRCALVGLALECAPEGSGDLGQACTASNDCYAGLACVGGACAAPPPGAPSYGTADFAGVDCEDTSTQSPVRAYFEVPGVLDPVGEEGDFFRLPFPNDARLKNGRLDLSGFPTPGAALLGYDPVQIYVDALSASADGWGAYPTVTFRFSGSIDFQSFRTTGAVNWVDITPGASEYGSSAGLGWLVSFGRSNYVCAPWMGIRRPIGAPLLPNHTYAVWLTTAGRDSQGGAISSSAHFRAMLATSTPADLTLAEAHAAYAPFRDYLLAESIDPGTILNATVFTTGSIREPMTQLAAAVRAAPLPAASSWVRCDGTVVSPCPDAEGERACGSGNASYDEYHALVSLPIFQQGTAPYLTNGGDITTGSPVRTEQVCMALTVPKTTMPATGWPLVVYAHGTGGSFRSHVRAEVAEALAQGAIVAGNVPMAVLGIDQVAHGPRRGPSTLLPEQLFFNFANPAAARGNPLQGAADQISLARFASNLDVSAAETGGDDIRIDPNAMVFFGHSQGATAGSLALPHADEYRAAVLSGNGASLMDALLTKIEPTDIARVLPIVLADVGSGGDLPGGVYHPVLSVLQHWIDPADPLSFAYAAGHEPTPKHLFQTYGIGDGFSPAATLETYALAARLQLATHDVSVTAPDSIGRLVEQPLPLAGNATVNGNPVTLVVREYESSGDGHFVVFDVPSANADAVRFLGMAADGQVPQVGQ